MTRAEAKFHISSLTDPLLVIIKLPFQIRVKGMGYSDYKNIYLRITNTYMNADILGRTAPIPASDTAIKKTKKQKKPLKWT